MKKVIVILSLALISLSIIGYLKVFKKKEPIIEEPKIISLGSMQYDLIHKSNNKNNFLISPYSIIYALSMLNDGALGNTKIELDNILKDTNLGKILNIPNAISVANGLFIKDEYKNNIKKEYINLLKNKYNAEVLFDEYKTPNVINNWVSNKTNKMIDKLLDEMSSDFVLGIINAISIDLKWQQEFKCGTTIKMDFTKENNDKIDVLMMQSDDDDSTYIYDDKVYGIIKPYKSYSSLTGKEDINGDINFEFVALIPKSNLEEYVNNFNIKDIDNLKKKEPNNKTQINLKLPRFKYDYTLNNLIDILNDMGVKEVFSKNADLGKITDVGLFIDQIIHKTTIDLSEEGTKAAAVTGIMFDSSSLQVDGKEIINITFDEPFMYLIREKNTNNIWFIGTVYEPTLYNENVKICNYE